MKVPDSTIPEDWWLLLLYKKNIAAHFNLQIACEWPRKTSEILFNLGRQDRVEIFVHNVQWHI